MQKQMVIYLKSDEMKTDEEWNALSEEARDAEVIVLIPSETVLLTTVILPKMNRTRLLQAIPFALEETLLDEVSDLHFAIPHQTINGQWPVAVIARKKMDDYLALLHKHGIKPDKLLPAVLALQIGHGLLENGVVSIKTGECAGFSCDQANLALEKEIKIVSNIEKLKLELPINLLQQRYAIKKSRATPIKKLLKISASMTIALVILMWVSPLGSYFILKNKSVALEDAINQIYKKQFPQAMSVVSPKRRIDEKLKKLRQASTNSDLLRWLALVGESKKNSSGNALQRFDYQHHVLTLEIISQSSEDLTRLTNHLIQQGLHVKQQNAVVIGSKIKASLQIS